MYDRTYPRWTLFSNTYSIKCIYEWSRTDVLRAISGVWLSIFNSYVGCKISFFYIPSPFRRQGIMALHIILSLVSLNMYLFLLVISLKNFYYPFTEADVVRYMLISSVTLFLYLSSVYRIFQAFHPHYVPGNFNCLFLMLYISILFVSIFF